MFLETLLLKYPWINSAPASSFHSDYYLLFPAGKSSNQLVLRSDYTYSHFRYGNFIRGIDDYSGKTLPSVPTHTLSFLADLIFKHGWYAAGTFYSASRIFLNDANTAFAEPYYLIGGKIGWRKTWHKKHKLNFYAGAENMLNEKYSLGNDINAPAGRYYNAAPPRNYYAGIALQWISPTKK